MPRIAKGRVRYLDGAWYAIVVVGPKKDTARALPGVTSERTATAWASALQDLVAALRALGRSSEIVTMLDQAIGVLADDPEEALERVRKSVAKRKAEVGAEKIATVRTPAKSGALTFRKFGQQWTSGEIHRLFPDHVKDKKSADKDAGALELHVYPVVGHLRLTDFGLREANDVLRRVPAERSSSVRRQVAQLMVRLCNLAVYPCEHIERSPLPKGFLPRVKVRPGAYLRPSEDRTLLGAPPDKVPLANRLLYGFLAREGMRKEEALAMTWSDLDLEVGAVRLDENKTDDPRSWALGSDVARALAWWRETHHKGNASTALVFGDVQDAGHLADALRVHMEAAGIEREELYQHTAKRRRMNAHGLRSTFVTIALANGRSEAWVMDRTGHRSSAMVNRYRKVARTAAELGLGPLTPLDEAIPEIPRRTSGRRRRVGGGKAPKRASSRSSSTLENKPSSPSRGRTGTPLRARDFKSGRVDPDGSEGAVSPEDIESAQDRTERDDPQPPPSSAFHDPTAAALASALEAASAAGEWTVVATLAAELQARRLAAAGNVVPLHRGRRAR